MGLLTPNQKLFANQMSRIVIDEDKFYSEENSSQEEYQSKITHAFLLRAIKRMARSKGIAD